jgi:hypothetical protein
MSATTNAYIIKRDGAVVGVTVSPLSWFHQRHGYSADHAVRHEGYTVDEAERWDSETVKRESAIARQYLARHDHSGADRSRLVRENCAACVLGGYRPKGGWGDPELDKRGAGPNVAGWARVFVQARQPVPQEWAGAFWDELGQDRRYPGSEPNWAYAVALARDIATFGVFFTAAPVTA